MASLAWRSAGAADAGERRGGEGRCAMSDVVRWDAPDGAWPLALRLEQLSFGIGSRISDGGWWRLVYGVCSEHFIRVRTMNRQFDGFRVEYAETENVILTGPMTVDPT